MARSTQRSERPAAPVSQPTGPEEHHEQQHVTRSPDYKAHYGRVQAAVWRRESEGRTAFSVSLTRSYKDKHDQWQRTTNLDEDDLLPAAKALDDVYTWIQRSRHQSREAALDELRVPPAGH
jgi:hypothetical protein